jgi:hypothetical protein
VRLTVVPAADSYLISWHRPDCPDTLTTCDIVMNGPVELNVEIALKPVVVATLVGSGRVVVHPVDVECHTSCNVPVDVGGVQINAFAGAGWHFVRWDNPCDGYTGAGSCVLVNVNADVTITAVFERHPMLTVTHSGNGSGSVSSELGAFTCLFTCSKSFAPGRNMSLVANASSGSTFAGWSGACSGTGACDLVVTEDIAVTATFTRNSGGGGSSSGGGGGGGGGRIDWLMLGALALLLLGFKLRHHLG